MSRDISKNKSRKRSRKKPRKKSSKRSEIKKGGTNEIDRYIKDPNTIWDYLPEYVYRKPYSSGLIHSDQDHKTYNEKMLDIIEDIENKINIEFINNVNINSYKKTLDYNKYGLIPGQRLATGNAFGKLGGFMGLSHHAIYLGHGWIFEMAPTTENKKERKGNIIKLGLSPINEWVNNSKSNGDPIFAIDDININIDRKLYLTEFFNRLKDRIVADEATAGQWGPWNNCESEAYYLASGDKATYQGKAILYNLTLTLLIEGLRHYYMKSDNSDCIKKYITENDNPCKDDTKVSRIFNSTCIVEPYSKYIRKESKRGDRSNKMHRHGKIKQDKNTNPMTTKYIQKEFRLVKKNQTKGRKKSYFEWEICPVDDTYDLWPYEY